MPSPRASPIALRWDKSSGPSPPKSESAGKRKKKKSKSKSKTKQQGKGFEEQFEKLNRELLKLPPPGTPGTVGTTGRIDSNEYSSDEEGHVPIQSNHDNIGHTPGPGVKMNKTLTKSTEDLKASSDQPKAIRAKTEKTLTEDSDASSESDEPKIPGTKMKKTVTEDLKPSSDGPKILGTKMNKTLTEDSETSFDSDEPKILDTKTKKTVTENLKASSDRPKASGTKRKKTHIEDPETSPDRPKKLGTKSKKTLTNDLKACSDRLKVIEEKGDEIASLRESIRVLEERIQRNEMRAAIRHDMIFDALKKISQDVGTIRSNSNAIPGLSESMSGSVDMGSSPPPNKKIKRSRSPGPEKASQKAEHTAAARQTMIRCLKTYTEDLNSASTFEEVKKCGDLCNKYAESLFRDYS
ncbi:hypothetical protein QBC37DRAFT_400860 [Rhypophila decipiens]|uniref:Uncharacterized protein n=1 Tax=Rhypophila decipiens TaxID=261697 RepID=A0AAN6Y5Q2_9PEZI|nr:hypothetical protein QBC37DRAFT_400860 [Rhypophila decipiens]